MCSVLTLPLWRYISQPALKLVVLFQALKVVCILIADLCCCGDKVVHAVCATKAAVRDVDGTIVAMMFTLSFAMVCFKALEIWHDLV